MADCYLIRNEVTSDAVLGYLYADGTVFATLEPAWRFNLPNISCIPAGEYDADYLPRSASGKYQEVYHLRDVPKRGGVLIHAGNLAKHTKGCILLGTRKGMLAGKRAVLNSRTAMQQFRDLIGKGSFHLTIYGDQHA